VARSSVRLSLGRFNTDEDIDAIVQELPDIVKKFREISALDIDEEY
jgi:cysteine desulfurase